MTNMLSDLRNVVAKRVAYNRTVREISAMPTSTAIDLGIFAEDAHKIARRAVYG